MNKKQLSLALVLSMLTAVVAAAHTLPSVQKIESKDGGLVLTPSKMIAPRVLDHEVGKIVWVNFVIDANGHTANVTPKDAEAHDFHLADRVAAAVEQWEFEPITNAAGQAEAVSVSMPLKMGPHDYSI